MKKIIFSISILISMLLVFVNIDAASFNINILGETSIKEETTLYVQVSSLSGFSTKSGGLCGLVAKLNYDDAKLELVSLKSLEDFTLVQGENVVIYKSVGVSTGTKVLEITFKNKALTAGEKTNIKLTNIVASDGENDITAQDVSKTITYLSEDKNTDKEEENNNSGNNINVSNKNDNVVNEEKEKSSDNYLSNITLSSGTISFDKNITTYNITVDYNVENIDVNAKTSDSLATLTGTGNHSLKVGKNIVELKVTAEDDSERTYTINVTRKAEEHKFDNVVLNPIDDDTNETNNNLILWIGIILVLIFIVVCGVIFTKRK